MSTQPEYHAWRKHFISCRGRAPTAYEAWVSALASREEAPTASAGPAPKPDPKNCTAKVRCDNGRITTESCTTKRPLIDDGESSDGERDYYVCPDCGKNITIDYREG